MELEKDKVLHEKFHTWKNLFSIKPYPPHFLFFDQISFYLFQLFSSRIHFLSLKIAHTLLLSLCNSTASSLSQLHRCRHKWIFISMIEFVSSIVFVNWIHFFSFLSPGIRCHQFLNLAHVEKRKPPGIPFDLGLTTSVEYPIDCDLFRWMWRPHHVGVTRQLKFLSMLTRYQRKSFLFKSFLLWLLMNSLDSDFF